MKRPFIFLLVLAAAVAAGIGVISATAGNSNSMEVARPALSQASQASPAADLRVTLDRLLGEHAVLAQNATNSGVTGSKSFPATAKSLDRNSVELSKAIASLYGKNAGDVFLNGSSSGATTSSSSSIKKVKAGQTKAVANLTRYTKEHGAFLAKATGLPKLAVQNDLLAHVLELKNQLDAYSAGNYTKAANLYRDAYAHMFMTGDLLAGAIAKQKNLK